MLPVVGFRPTVRERRELGTEVVQVVEVEARERVAVAVGTRSEDGAPRVHDHGPPVGPAPVRLPAPLRRRDDERLVLDGPRSEQELPVVLARLQGERRRDRQDLRSAPGSPSRIEPPRTYTPSARAREARNAVVGPGTGSAFSR